MRREDHERIVAHVEQQVLGRALEQHRAGSPTLDQVLAESSYHERLRLEDEPPRARRTRQDKAFWQGVAGQLHGAEEGALRGLLQQVVSHYLQEVQGNLNDRIYNLMSAAMPPALGLLLTGASPRQLLRGQWQHGSLDDTVILQGEVEPLRRLNELGTVILAPTHSSNLDSMVLGFAAYRLGLPPFVYGAGLNLFTNPLLALFMHNLGAYTVDRRKRDPLYKEVLKAYATSLLHCGYNNLFFPGGTRSRCGAMEQHLKLGLLGTGVQAYGQNLHSGRPNPRVFIVPATLSYQLVLEAETLIDDFLKEVGKARYIISDDAYSQPRRVVDFLGQLLSLDSKIYLTLGAALDPFGNPVDSQGQSLDPRGRVIDPQRFVVRAGAVATDPARDAEYTREVGLRLQQAYLRDNVVQSTHVAARAAFDLLRHGNPGLDLIRLVRAGGEREVFALRTMYEAMERLLGALRSLETAGRLRLTAPVRHQTASELLADATAHFATYHTRATLSRRGDLVRINDRSLLFYYQNRLEGYGLESLFNLTPALSADHRAVFREPRRHFKASHA